MMLQEKNIEEPVYSRLANDPDLADIVEMFVDEMPERVENLLHCLDEKNWNELRQAAHQLKGAAGSYGFEPISPCASRVESAIRNNEPEERIREAVMELVELCGRVQYAQHV
jgi:histidine phosphotransfer protein HptB